MIDSLVSILVPSRDRAETLERFISTTLDSTKDLTVELIAILDFPDQKSHDVVKTFKEVKIVTMPSSYQNGTPQYKYQAGYLASKGDWIVSGADDIVFHHGWLHACLEWPNKGFIGLADPYWEMRHLATHIMVSKEYVNRVMCGRFGLPWYYVWWADYEWNTKAERAGALTFCPRSTFNHYHADDAGRAPDNQNLLSKQFRNADRITYLEREAANFPEVWKEVGTLKLWNGADSIAKLIEVPQNHPSVDVNIMQPWDNSGLAEEIDTYWQSSNEVFFREQLIIDITKHLQPGGVLEVGCGSGLICEGLIKAGLLWDRVYVGGDSSKTMLALAKKRCMGLDFKELDIHDLSGYRSDNVLCIQVLQHLKDYKIPIIQLGKTAKKLLYIVSWFSDKDEISVVDQYGCYNSSFGRTEFDRFIRDNLNPVSIIWEQIDRKNWSITIRMS
jgi:2-polyprenyl-3-methyl-5-hydroxy-6-metoxy-1,4-benzoquinol methylase